MRYLASVVGFALISVFAIGCGSRPTAVAGAGRTVAVGQVVQLDGSASSDPEGRPLSYEWTFVAMPAGSAALLSGAPTPATAVNPSFVPDVEGEFILSLTVTSPGGTSEPSTVKITAGQCGTLVPVAQIGILGPIPITAPVVAPPTPALVLPRGATVHLDASTSSSADNIAPCSLGKALFYRWRFVSLPNGSNARLNDVQVINPSFDIDTTGAYVIELVVSDSGGLKSEPVRVQINGIDPRQRVSGASRSSFNSLVLDPTASGAPRIAYYDPNDQRPMIARCTANCDTAPVWTVNPIDGIGTGQHISLAVDKNGNLFAAYYDSTNNRPRYAVSTDHGVTWKTSQIPDGGMAGRWTSVGVDRNGMPAVAYRAFNATGNEGTRYARCTGNCKTASPTWDFKTVDSTATSGYYNSLAFDSQGNPAIAYRRSDSNASVMYATCTANCTTPSTSTWSLVEVDLPGSNNFQTNPIDGSGVSLAFTSMDGPNIAFRDDSAQMLLLASCSSGCTATAAWSVSVVDATGGDCGEYPSLAISTAAASLDQPRITYRDVNNNQLRFAYFEPTLGWQHTVLDQIDPMFSSLKLTSNEGVRVSYSPVNTWGLRFIAFGP